MKLTQRVLVRFFVAMALLLSVESGVRARRNEIAAIFFRDYRFPEFPSLPFHRFQTALLERRQEEPRTIYFGVGGPSTTWGINLAPDQSIPAQMRRVGDDGSLRIFNIAQLRDRFSDDRAIGELVGEAFDAVAIPVSTFSILAMENGACPAHPEVLEWEDVPRPFAVPPLCPIPDEHRVNLWIDRRVSGAWTTYGMRAEIRQHFFPETGDAASGIVSKLRRVANEARKTVERGYLITEQEDASASPALSKETELLCETYRRKGVSVYFFHLPTLSPIAHDPKGKALGRFRSVVQGLKARGASCQILDLDFTGEERLDALSDFRDIDHPNGMGSHKIGVALRKSIDALIVQGIIVRRSGP